MSAKAESLSDAVDLCLIFYAYDDNEFLRQFLRKLRRMTHVMADKSKSRHLHNMQ